MGMGGLGERVSEEERRRRGMARRWGTRAGQARRRRSTDDKWDVVNWRDGTMKTGAGCSQRRADCPA